jgi:hypothetical protein
VRQCCPRRGRQHPAARYCRCGRRTTRAPTGPERFFADFFFAAFFLPAFLFFIAMNGLQLWILWRLAGLDADFIMPFIIMRELAADA